MVNESYQDREFKRIMASINKIKFNTVASKSELKPKKIIKSQTKDLSAVNRTQSDWDAIRKLRLKRRKLQRRRAR